MRQAGSYILSASIHAAGLALLAFAPGFSQPEFVVTSGGLEVGSLINSEFADASQSHMPPVEFELSESLATSARRNSSNVSNPGANQGFAPERTLVPLKPAAARVTVEALPALEVRRQVRQAPRVARPEPMRFDNAELAAAFLADQLASPVPEATPITDSKPELPTLSPAPDSVTEAVAPDTGPKSEVRSEGPVEPPAPEPEPDPKSPAPSVDPRSEPTEKPAAKPATNPKPVSKAPPQESRQDKDSKPREASRKGGVGQASGVDAVPRPLAGNGQPEYPPDAFDRRQEGTVVLHILVSEKGITEKVTVAKSSGVKSLDHSAVSALRDWKFQPAMRNGKPTALLVRKVINFRIDDSGN